MFLNNLNISYVFALRIGIALAGKITALGGGVILDQAKKETEQRNLIAANVPPSK